MSMTDGPAAPRLLSVAESFKGESKESASVFNIF